MSRKSTILNYIWASKYYYLTTDEKYMHRCLELAALGAGHVAPNPMVGAVLVHKDRIIGEGWHKLYGQSHAEVNCINSVRAEDVPLISQSTLYVSLEPCAHTGKTPPCVDLIIAKKIPEVIIGCQDPFKEVNGKGILRLKAAGVKVKTGVLENECRDLNKRFFTFYTQHRPYIILKWAQSVNGKISADTTERTHISNNYTNQLVHRWRSEEAGILVGTHTALQDDPALTTRLWPGNSPVRMVLDMELKLTSSSRLLDRSQSTIVFNEIKHEEQDNIMYYQVSRDTNITYQILHALYQLKIQSLIVEGGAQLIQSFIDEGLWDEARIITNRQLTIGNGLTSPILPKAQLTGEEELDSDTIEIFRRSDHGS